MTTEISVMYGSEKVNDYRGFHLKYLGLAVLLTLCKSFGGTCLYSPRIGYFFVDGRIWTED